MTWTDLALLTVGLILAWLVVAGVETLYHWWRAR
jgi:hypothetical protein